MKKMEEEIVYIPKYKKWWLSITSFERYPEMATEGVGRAIGYLVWLMFMFSLILAIAFTIKFVGIAKDGIDFIDKNFNEISYSEGILNIGVENFSTTTNLGNIIINTEEMSESQLKEIENKKSLTNIEIIWLRDCVIVKHDNEMERFFYKDFFDNLEINSFDKTMVIDFFNKQLNSPKIYFAGIIVLCLGMLIPFFLKTIIDVLFLSLFGMISTFFAKIQIRYRAIFNMSVYAITLSTVLQLIYIIINLFTGFVIKQFDLMYVSISFICLIASVFMIKSDVIKQQIELMKVMASKKQEQEEQEEQKENNDKDEKDKEEEKKEDKQEDNKNDTEKKEETPPTVEGET